MRQHGKQEKGAEGHQEADLGQLEPEEFNGVRAGTDGIVNYALWQFQCEVKQGKQRQRDGQEGQLFAFGIFPYEIEK